MARYSVAEAENNLSKLIDAALAGEEVVITRHGHPVAEVRPSGAEASPSGKCDVEWLRKHRVAQNVPALDAGAFVSRMRDEEWN